MKGIRWMICVSVVVLEVAVCLPDIASSDGSISLKQVDHNTLDPLYTLELREADLRDVLLALGQENDLNILISKDVTGTLTLSFHKIRLMDALEAILRINNLASFRKGNILRVTKSPFPEGEENLVTRIVQINFSTAREVSDGIKALLSKKGSVTIDARTNTLIIRDVPENVEKIAEIVKTLDSKTPQVMIEARIVEANTNFARDLGIQWGGKVSDQTKEGSFQITGGSLTGGTGLSGSQLAVNLPALVAPGSGGAVAFSFGRIRKTPIDLDIQISAMEDRGQGKILSHPRIMTLDNKEARISVGTEILIPTTVIQSGTALPAGAAPTGVTTINAKLELAVTPHVTPDQQIVIHVQADKKDADFSQRVNGIPALNTRSATTDLLVDNGETIVIGGIFTRSESVSEKSVPFLSRIPLLGYLFRREIREDRRNELLIFLTPTIQKL